MTGADRAGDAGPDRPRTTDGPALAWWRLAGVGVATVTVLWLLTFAYRYLDDVANGVDRPWLAPFLEEMSGHYLGFLILAPIMLLAWRLRLARRPWPARLAFHAAGVLLYSAIHTTGSWLSREALFPLFGLGDYDYGRMPVRYAMELPKDVSVYVLAFVLAALFERYRASRDAELRARDLEARLARAQLQNLQAQLNPHFVFNALNTISSVMYEDVARADRMLAGLSELLRRALHASHRHEVTLAEELEVLELYVELMRARFGERLRVEIAVDDGLRDALVPTLLLQPLVENAIRHGAPPPPAATRVEVRIRRDVGSVVLEVEDNGPGLAAGSPAVAALAGRTPSTSPSRQVGLANTVERLRGLYGDAQAMTFGSGRLGGLRITIRIPYRVEPRPEPVAEGVWTGSAS